MIDDDISDTIMEILSQFFRASDRAETRMPREEYEKHAKDKERHVLNQVLSVNKPDAGVHWYEVHLSSNSISMDELTSIQKELRKISVAIESIRSRPEIDEVKIRSPGVDAVPRPANRCENEMSDSTVIISRRVRKKEPEIIVN